MISILISTYNGQRYLKEQLDSLFSQTYKNIEIIVRDDGSSDNTLDILNSYDVNILEVGENIGVKRSFSILLEHALKNTASDYFMFCDQDDVWENDKIEKTFIRMQKFENEFLGTPILIHTDLQVVDEKLNILDNSFMNYQNIEAKKNKLNDLLLQNIITGCTIMINRKLAELALPIPNDCMMHDWWLGLVSSQFGKIDYINESTLKYRQHSSNSIGAKNFTLQYLLEKLQQKQILSDNILQAKSFLNTYRDSIDDNAIEMLEDFITIESKSFFTKRKILLKHKLLKQGFIRNIGLLVKI